MSEAALAVSEIDKLCTYPGCTRPRRPDPATGRPSRYCERADEGGGPIHNRGTAWKARRAHTGDAPPREDGLTAPVSMARATLEQRLSELPGRFEDLRQYLDGVVLDLRAAGDVEAAGSEVEDAHREALTKVTEAERLQTISSAKQIRICGEIYDQLDDEEVKEEFTKRGSEHVATNLTFPMLDEKKEEKAAEAAKAAKASGGTSLSPENRLMITCVSFM